MGLNADSWRMKPQTSARSSEKPPAGCHGGMGYIAAVIALDVVALVPVGVADRADRPGSEAFWASAMTASTYCGSASIEAANSSRSAAVDGAELQQRQRAAAGAVVAQHVGPALRSSARHVPVRLDLHAERLLRDQAVEGAAVQRGALEVGRELLRIAGQQVGARRPERTGRQRPRRGLVGRGIGHQLEAARRLGHVAARKARQAGVPVGVGRHADLDRHLHAALRIGFERAGADAAAPQLDFLRAQQVGRRLAVEQDEGGVEAAVVGHALQARPELGGAARRRRRSRCGRRRSWATAAPVLTKLAGVSSAEPGVRRASASR